MHELLSALQEILANNTPAAYCRLVETRGSTPQKAGAAMLVHANGQQWGTIGGGCIEAEVKRRAIALLQSGQSEICPFQLDGDYGWDDGLICGGRMKIWIQPICQNEQSKTYFRALAREIAAGHGLTEIVQHEAELALPTGPGPGSALLDASAQILATLNKRWPSRLAARSPQKLSPTRQSPASLLRSHLRFFTNTSSLSPHHHRGRACWQSRCRLSGRTRLRSLDR
ncbi:MAG: XdhC family protein [Pirellulales bacterium]